MRIGQKFRLYYLLLKGRFIGKKYIIITRNIYKCYNECYKYGYEPSVDKVMCYTGFSRELIDKIKSKHQEIDLIFTANEKAGCVLYETKTKRGKRK